jgi:hypothetical protein
MLLSVAVDFDIDANSRLSQIFKTVGEVQFVWEYIWLTVKCRRAVENDSDVFIDENIVKFNSLCSYFDEHSSFNIEHQVPLYELLYLFMIADKIEHPEKDYPVKGAEKYVPNAEVDIFMDIEIAVEVEGLTDIDRTATGIAMGDCNDTGDVKVSKFNLPALPDCEQEKILDKVIQVAGVRINRKRVHLP